eukprot:7034166-Alexandrium_andersonii.AAC.1
MCIRDSPRATSRAFSRTSDSRSPSPLALPGLQLPQTWTSSSRTAGAPHTNFTSTAKWSEHFSGSS